MFYIHQTSCISPQKTFGNIDLSQPKESVENKLLAIEPAFENIPLGLLRRMGKAVRIGVGAALPLIKDFQKLDGIIIGTANGGMEDCIKFLNQIIQYDEGTLTPTNFVQSTINAIASQIAFLSVNKGYNITHTHRGLAFENAMIDVDMLAKEFPQNNYLLGGVDEISNYNWNIESLGKWYKKEFVSNKDLYEKDSTGSLAGEGAAMFLVNGIKENALAKVEAINILHNKEEIVVAEKLKYFLNENLADGNEIDLFLSGENGDNRLLKHYLACENIFGKETTVARFKHLFGEFPTASALALWLTCHILQTQSLPQHLLKKESEKKSFKKILIYNNYKGLQHSFMLVSKN